MRLIWLLPLCTAWSWLFLLSTFTPERFTAAVPLGFPILLGAGAAALSLRKFKQPLPPSAALFFIPLLLVVLLIPFPYSLGAWIMAAGLFAGICSMGAGRLVPVGLGLFFCGFIILFQGALNPLFYAAGARFHEIGILNRIAYPLVRLFGLPAGMSEAVIYLPTYENLLTYVGTLEKSGAYLLFHLVSGGMLLLAFLRAGRGTWLRFLVLTFCYTVVRYVFMIFIFARVNEAEIFWNPWTQGLSWLPLSLVLGAAVPLYPRTKNEWAALLLPSFGRRSGLVAALFLAAGIAFTGIWGFHDPGMRKQGRILIDETRSDWEWSNRKFDTTWYGSRSTYNYYCMADYLDHFYEVTRNTDRKLTLDTISGYDILILKTPTAAYSEEEIESIVTYVRNGGGVWLIGDHTNVFGMSYYLNAVARRFGMYFHYDSTYDLATGRLNAYERPRVFPHPVVRTMPRFLFATGCTLAAPFSADNVMLGYGLRSRMLSYSGRSFFEDKPTQNYEFGLFLQSAGLRYGEGRVLLFTDSTCFSNFYMFIPGKPELAVGSIEWLNRKNVYGAAPLLFLLIFIAASASGLHIMRNEREKIFGLWFFSSLSAAALGFFLFTALTDNAYSMPEPHTDFKTAVFETAHSDFTLPVKALVDKHPKNYHTFFVWTQRKGYFPTLEPDLSTALEKGDLVVLINPVKPFSEGEIRKIGNYMENGGRLLILDGPRNKRSTTNRLIEAFGIGLPHGFIKETGVNTPDGRNMGRVRMAGTVTGGSPSLLTPDGRSLFSVVRKGKGVLGVMSFAGTFANPVMGGTQVRPSEARLSIYNLMYHMLDIMEQPDARTVVQAGES